MKKIGPFNNSLCYNSNKQPKGIRILIVSLWLLFCFIFPFHNNANGGDKLSAQKILEHIDTILAIPKGIIKGKILHTLLDGRSYLIYVKGFIGAHDSLFVYRTRRRNELLKILFNDNGNSIWVHGINIVEPLHAKGTDQYTKLLETNFNYVDLSKRCLSKDYDASISGSSVVKGREAYRLRLIPKIKGGYYGQLILYVGRKNLIPLRIDYYDKSNQFFKTMSVVRTINKGTRLIPVRYDMFNIQNETVSILTFFGFEKNVSFDKKMFRYQSLTE